MPKKYTIYRGFIVTENSKERTCGIYLNASDEVPVRIVDDGELDSEIDDLEKELKEAEGTG